MRILMIDDQEDSRDITNAVLISAGFSDVATAASAWDALKILGIWPKTDGPPSVDLILLDIVMQNIDGIEICARVRKDERYVNQPIIMLTSLDDEDSLKVAFSAGATDYITKPFTQMELVERIQTATTSRTINEPRLESSTP
jgi:sigma-B regulation protein RsbU (phosphoserine phosphatase)